MKDRVYSFMCKITFFSNKNIFYFLTDSDLFPFTRLALNMIRLPKHSHPDLGGKHQILPLKLIYTKPLIQKLINKIAFLFEVEPAMGKMSFQ